MSAVVRPTTPALVVLDIYICRWVRVFSYPITTMVSLDAIFSVSIFYSLDRNNEGRSRTDD